MAIECYKQVALSSTSGIIIVLACIKHFVIGFRGSNSAAREAYESFRVSTCCRACCGNKDLEELVETDNTGDNQEELHSAVVPA